MAKGSAMGLWKGKKGSSVFYQIKNSNSLQKQGVRERNYEPANPQTVRQAGQRMRMYPAQAVYGILKSVIERSWQGVKYGQMSRQAYLKRALRTDIFPAVEKGDGVIVPGPYQIAKGTLQEYAAYVEGTGAIRIPIFCGDNTDWDSTVDEFTDGVLQKNPGLRQGDQITIICCHTNVDGDGFYWDYVSVTLDSSNTEERMGDIWGKIASSPGELVANNAGIRLISENYLYMAAACIISREAETPLRSTAFLACDYVRGGMPNYYSTEAIARAKRSYMRPLSVIETDWPADPADQGDGSGGEYTIGVRQVTTNSQGGVDPTPGGTVSGAGSYIEGELVTLTATPDAQHVFTGWYPSEADALANTNRISTAGVFLFTAGEMYTDVEMFYGKFMPQL